MADVGAVIGGVMVGNGAGSVMVCVGGEVVGLRLGRASVERVRRQVRRGHKAEYRKAEAIKSCINLLQCTVLWRKQQARRGEKRQASEPKGAFENGDFFTERKRSKNAKASVLAHEVIGVAFRRIGSGFTPLLPPKSGEREGMGRGALRDEDQI